MAEQRYVGDRFTILSTDSMPTNVTTGALLHVLDTGETFTYDGSTWNISPQISNLGDVTISSLASGHFLSYNGSNWVNGLLTLSDISDLNTLVLDDISDVIITTPTTDEVLSYNGSNWVNVDISTLISDVNALNDLSDVTISTPADNEVLAYNNATSEWINQTPAEAGLLTSVASDASLTGDGTSGSPLSVDDSQISITLSQVTDSGEAAALDITGVDTLVVSGTAGTGGNLMEWNGDGDAVDSGVATSSLMTTSTNIGDLNDVAITSVADNNILQYNSGTGDWENTAISVATDATITGDGSSGSVLSVNINDAGTASDELFSADHISSNYQATSEKNQANGYVGLDSNTKISSTYLPALSITEVFPVADITARDALTVGTGDGEVQEGDVAVVLDASADTDVPSGSASYIWDGTAWQLMGTPDINAAGIDTQIQYNDNGDFGASSNLTYNDSSSLLTLTGHFKLKENGTPAAVADDEAAYFVETTGTETFVKVRLGNGQDAIVASYVQ
jgi:hypothetical protein